MPLKSWLALIAAITAMYLVGCSRRGAAPPPPPSTGLGSFTYNDTTAWYISRGGKVTVLVWIDSMMIRGGAKEAKPGHVQGQMTTWPGNKPLVLEVKDGTISLNGKDYVLAKGALFLVYSREDPVRTVQLDRDLTAVEATEADLRRLANTDLDIMPFVKAARATQGSQPARSAVESQE